MKHALFVAFHYPPEASSSGVLRTLKYTRYLADFGWRVTVLTVEEDAYETTDQKLLDQIPRSVRIVRTPYLNTKRHISVRGVYPALLAIPDTWIGWVPWAVSAGRRVWRSDPFDLIYSTSPFASAHVAAMRLTRLTGQPWVTDFRDPWYEDPPEPGAPAGPVYRWLNRVLEKRVVKFCNRVVGSTTQLRDALQVRYPNKPKEHFLTILNGYDEADFAMLPVMASGKRDRFVIVHAGSVNADFRDPRPFFEALRETANRGYADLRRIEVRFLGAGKFAESEEVRGSVTRLGLGDVVTFAPRVSYEESLRELSRADLLLLLQASPDTANLVPAKLYEYLRAFKPVLALVNAGATRELVAAVGGGWAVDPADASDLRDSLARIYRLWVQGSLASVHADDKALRQYDRRVLTGRLAAVFDELVGAQAVASEGQAGYRA